MELPDPAAARVPGARCGSDLGHGQRGGDPRPRPFLARILLGQVRFTLEISVSDSGARSGGRELRIVSRFGDGHVTLPVGFPGDVLYDLVSRPYAGDTLIVSHPQRIFAHREALHRAHARLWLAELAGSI